MADHQRETLMAPYLLACQQPKYPKSLLLSLSIIQKCIATQFAPMVRASYRKR